MDRLLISEVKELSLIDVIGSPSIVLWLPYCNFRCPWCQNTPIVNGSIVREVTVNYLRELFSSAKGFIEYVHVTGGEPTLHSRVLKIIYKVAREYNLKTSLNTNGSNPNIVKCLINSNLLDHIAIDVKAPLDNKALYSKVTGIPLDLVDSIICRIEETINLAFKSGLEVELRTTLIPDLNSKHVIAIAKHIARIVGEYRCHSKCVYVLQQFIPSETVRDLKYRLQKPTPIDKLVRVGKEVKDKYGLRVYVRSLDKGIVRL